MAKRSLIRRQYNSSNVHFADTNPNKEVSLSIGSKENITTFSSSKLPFRAKSKSTSKCSFQSLDRLKSAHLMMTSWADHSINTQKLKCISSIYSKLAPNVVNTSMKNIKTEVKSRLSLNNVCAPLYGPRVADRLNKNNSSCNKLSNIKLLPFNGMTHENNVKTSLIQNNALTTLAKTNVTNTNQSIFKFFKLKINKYRNEIECQENNKKVKNLTDGKVATKWNLTNPSNVDSLENANSKQFLVKIYNECRKLNCNIVKLYSDTTKLKSKFRELSSSGRRDRRRTQSMTNELELSAVGADTELASTTRPFCEGASNRHYYHLACVLPTDTAEATARPQQHEDITSISSMRPLSRSREHEVTKPAKEEEEEKGGEDDTLCDLDEDDEMRTEFGNSTVPVLGLAVHSPRSVSNYVTATDAMEARHIILSSSSSNISCCLSDLPPPPSRSQPSQLPLPATTSHFVSVFEREFLPQFELLRGPAATTTGTDVYSSTITIDCCNKQQPTAADAVPPQIAATSAASCFFNPFKPPRGLLASGNRYMPLYSDSNNSCVMQDEDKDEGLLLFENHMYSGCSRQQIRRRKKREESKVDLALGRLNSNQNSNNEPASEAAGAGGRNTKFLQLPAETKASDHGGPSGGEKETVEEEPKQRVAPMTQLMMQSRVSEEMSQLISIQQQAAQQHADRNGDNSSPGPNRFIEKQRQKKIARQQEQHQKAKDMAVEAARMRKERQAELQAFDSYDSSRVASKLFADDEDEEPAFSLFDAIHFNFNRRRERKPPKELAQSTIKGILPEAPLEEPAPPQSPITLEKFRNQPLELVKVMPNKKRYADEDLHKYELVSSLPATPATAAITTVVTKTLLPETKHSISSSSSNSSGTDSVTYTISSPSSSSTESPYFSSSSTSSISLSVSRHKKNSTVSPKKNKKNKKKTGTENKLELLTLDMPKEEAVGASPSEIMDKKPPSDTEVFVADESSTEMTRFKGIKFEEIFSGKLTSNVKRQQTVEEKPDQEEEKTDLGHQNNQKRCIETQTKKRYENFYDDEYEDEDEDEDEDEEVVVKSIPLPCHLNHQSQKYNVSVLDRALPLQLCLPSPDTSLSSFVTQLISQLHSLDDTVDILLGRMDLLEANLLDCSKHLTDPVFNSLALSSSH